jgi:peptidoglycan/xylan/chitin deacetylase (PgdA/CDA1 family)
MSHKIPILLYHSVSETSAPTFRRWVVSPIVFENQMFYLFKQGYTPLTVSEFVLLQNNPDKKRPLKPVVITFDDGFEDFYTHAVPILDKFNFASTLYVTTAYLGKMSEWLRSEGEGNRPMLHPEQVKKLPHHRVEIGAHTHTHPQLDLLDLQTAKAEIQKSKTILEGLLQTRLLSFAYPHGYYSNEVRQLVMALGFKSACGVKEAISNWQDDSLTLSRIIISNEMIIEQFGSALTGKGYLDAPKGERFKTKLGRIRRRLEYARMTL